MFDSATLEPARLLCPWDFPDNTGLPFPTPGDLPDPGMEPVSFMSPILSDGFFTSSTTWEAHLESASQMFILANVDTNS